MNRGTKVLALATATSVAAALAGGVGGAAAASRPQTRPHASAVTLDFPSWQANEVGYDTWYNLMIKEFEKQHPGVTVHFYEVPFTSYVQTITTRLAAGDAPDILVLPERDYSAFASAHDLLNLSPLLAKTNIVKSWTPAQQEMLFNGKYYGLLMQDVGYVLFANKQLLAAKGLSVPKTYSQLLSDAKALTGNGNYGIAMPTAQDPNLFFYASMFVTGNGQQWAKGKKYLLTDPAVVKDINQWRTLARYAAPGLQTSQDRTLYFGGKAAFMIDGAFELPAVAAEGTAAVKAHTVVAPLPVKHQVGELSSSIQIPASVSGEKRKLAWEFIQLLARRGSQVAFVKALKTPAPMVAADQGQKKSIPFQSAQIAAATGTPVMPSEIWFQNNFNNISTAIDGGLTQMLSSSAPTGSILKSLVGQLPTP